MSNLKEGSSFVWDATELFGYYVVGAYKNVFEEAASTVQVATLPMVRMLKQLLEL